MVEARGGSTILQQRPEGRKIEQREVPKKIFQFTPEGKAGLKERGFVVFPLMGESIEDLRKKGMKFQSTWHEEFKEFEEHASINSEVAGKFLPKSNNKSWKEQNKEVDDYGNVIKIQKEIVDDYGNVIKIQKAVTGVKAIIGTPADNLVFIEALKLYDEKNEILELLKKSSVRCAGKSPIPNIYNKVDGFGVTVGNMDSEGKPLITGRASRPSENVYVIAMIVPEDLPVEEPAK